jgi:vacuolar-type H+-ATPase subunit E/Vma4
MSENRDLKERFGHLGMYLIEKAQEEIKNLNQQILFQKAEIKKRYRERTEDRSEKLRNQFIKAYNQKINNQLTESILYSKDRVLKLKNQLVNRLIKELVKDLEQKIDSNYSNYINYLQNSLEKNKRIFEYILEPILTFTPRDYEYFSENKKKINSILNKSIKIKESNKEFLGGYIIESEVDEISYNYTFGEIIQDKMSIVEKVLVSVISESDVKDLQVKFEKFTDDQKEKIEEYLIEYDGI